MAVHGHHSQAENREVDDPTNPHSTRHTTSTRMAWPFQRWTLSVRSPSASP